MAFSEINDERRIYINLSSYAQSIIEEDLRSFNIATESSFINTIFKNFRQEANASVYIRQQEYKEQLLSQLQDINTLEKQHIIDLLSGHYAESLLQKNLEYPKGKSKKYKLSTGNLRDYLNDDDYCKENIYYHDKISAYLKAVMEEYCRKTYVEREYIYYKDTIAIISDAIRSQKKLSIVLDDSKKIKMKPYAIISNNEQTYNYLVGYTHSNYIDSSTENPIPIRLSRITKVKRLEKHSFISQQNISILQNLIETNDIAFLSSKEDSFTIKLSPNGVKKYNTSHHIRPNYISKDSSTHTYVFRCPRNQFEFYFFKFGKDVEVLDPPDMREHFKAMYSSALDIYN